MLRPFHILCLFHLTIILFLATHGFAQTLTVRFVDGEGDTITEVESVLHEDNAYLPVETLKTVFDSEMSHLYRAPKKQLTLKTKGKELLLLMGNPAVSIDAGKQTVTIDTPPQLIQGQPMLPIKFFLQVLPILDENIKVLYNTKLKRIRIMPKTVKAPDIPDGPREWRIIIDPGHGGQDDIGCKSQNGLLEKDVVLAVAKEVLILGKQHGLSIQLTRDQYIKKTREQRAQITNRNQGKLFLSLHCNASFSPNHKGMRIFLNNPNGQLRFRTRPTQVLGRKHLNILTQANFLKQSRNFAATLQKELNFLAEDPIIINEFPIITLTEIYMPAVLFELGYLSNTNDATRLSNPDHISELALAIVRAIQIYSTSVNQAAKPREFQERDMDTN